jgi:hypothetical protein
MSEERAQSLAVRFRDTEAIIEVIDAAYACGIHSFMVNTHDRVAELCDHFRAHPEKYRELRLYPSMPYAHKYANAVHEKGIIGAVNQFVFAGRGAGQAISAVVRGGVSAISRDMIEIMRLLVDAEMSMFRGLTVPAIFLQNIVTDLLLGLGVKEVFTEYAGHIRRTYGAEPAFNTMNMPALVDFLLECGIENPIVCSSINKSGFLMTSGRQQYERALAEKRFRPMAMSIFASGAISAAEAVEYVCGLPNIQSIVFGASSRAHIEQTRNMIRYQWGLQ